MIQYFQSLLDSLIGRGEGNAEVGFCTAEYGAGDDEEVVFDGPLYEGIPVATGASGKM